MSDLTIREKTNKLKENEAETMDAICSHVANGGSLIDLCEVWGVNYGNIISWIMADRDGRGVPYTNSQNARAEWSKERLLLELRRMASTDIRKLYNEDGELLPVSEWPSEVAAQVKSIETVEEFEGKGKDKEQIGWTKKVTFWSKEKAIELLGKNQALWLERVELNGKLTLEDLIMKSRDVTEDER